MILFKERFIDKLPDTTLLAFRVLIASTLGLILCYVLFSFSGDESFRDRIYWVVIAVVSVAASTSTSVVITRAKAIIIFSLLGTSLGSVVLMFIQDYIPHNFTLVATLCGIALALWIYTLFLNYATSVFFIHIYLVMFFGLFIGWDTELFFVRVTCVAIGTVCIVVITFLSRGQKNRSLFNKEMYSIYGEFKKIVNDVDRSVRNRKIISLVERNIKLNEILTNAKYEFSTTKKYYEYKKIVILMDELLINLKTYRTLFIQQKKHNSDLYKELVKHTQMQIKKNFDRLTIRYDRALLNR
ncbi:membrane protein [Candidatus Francisella endociliophora]|uniref:Membrane protein n=1 Tax=Candidatus Francisella endociliophora TaxID=653937 RepID=A0A097EMZ3_9GAMM|nr:FUSC family protein [Francisella sp. FSC1006]AIT08934.1 membrane protein [Francisella sp. FSC1006]